MQQVKEYHKNQTKLSPGKLLNQNGSLQQEGYAYSLVKQYKRSDIKTSTWRIKQWDYYYVGDNNYGVALTIADLSYSALVSVTVLDFREKRQWTKSINKYFTFGSLRLPETSMNGDIQYTEKNLRINFQNLNGERRLICKLQQFQKNIQFSCDIFLTSTTPFSMVIATPFETQKYFYYNQKINLLAAKGWFSLGNIKHNFGKDAYGVLDWGRGVWTYSNTWYWASMSGEYGNHRYGLNLGYGFGNTKNATQNVFFFDNQVYKLNDIKFNIPMDKKGVQSYMEDWTFTSEGRQIQLKFKPLIDRYANFNFLLIQSIQHQVFGYFSGTIKINEHKFSFQNILGFAEKVKNRW